MATVKMIKDDASILADLTKYKTQEEYRANKQKYIDQLTQINKTNPNKYEFEYRMLRNKIIGLK